MEPIQTPSNDALHMQIQALKLRILECEGAIDAHREHITENRKRSLELTLQVKKKVNKVASGCIVAFLCIIVINLGTLLRYLL